MASSARVERVADEIRKVIVNLLATKIRDPRLKWISITGVDVSKDLSSAKIFFSSLNQKEAPEDMLKALNAAQGFFRTNMGKELRLRIVPHVRFFFDESLSYGNRMDEMIQKARAEDANFIQTVSSVVDDSIIEDGD